MSPADRHLLPCPHTPDVGPTHSLARRLARTLIAWVGAVWLLCLLCVVGFVNHEINSNFDHEMKEIANRMVDIALGELDAHPGTGVRTAAAPLIDSDDPVIFQVVDNGGTMLMRSSAAPALRYPVPLRNGFHNTPGWRVYTVKHPTRPLYLHLADPSRERRIARNRTLYGLLIPLGAMMLILPLLLHAIARRELAVLQRLESQIAQRSGTDLRPVDLAHMPYELRSVGEHVNRLLARLSYALDVERALAANAAHELRTPLAAVRLRLETALDTGLARGEVEAALASLATLSHRTEKLLQLSRAESGASLSHEAIDLERLAAAVAQEFWSLPGLRDRLVLQVPEHFDPAGPDRVIPARGDIDSLAIGLRNLVENALRYGDGSPVEIAVEAPSTLVVRDGGSGVPPQRLARLQERHVRDSAEHAGYGLGLSIVGTIMQKHGGRLQLTSPRSDGRSGLEARLVLSPA